MKIVKLIPGDSRQDFWLFRVKDINGSMRYRPEYADLACSACGKIDELGALERGFPIGFSISSKRDFIAVHDGLFAVSERFRTVYESERLTGLRFFEIPQQHHSIIWPLHPVKTDEASAGFQYGLPKCAVCGRYREAIVGPFVHSMEIPSDPRSLFASELWLENIRGRMLRLFAREEASALLKQAKMKGLEIIRAH